MRIFNKSVSYTLKAVIYLASNSEDRLILALEIAKKEKIPYYYLAKILQRLTKFGIVTSTKGRNGGFQITEKGLNSSISDIIEKTDGIDSFIECILNEDDCTGKATCALHKSWVKIRNALNDSIFQVKIKDLISK